MKQEPIQDSRSNMRKMYAQAMHEQKISIDKNIEQLEKVMSRVGEAHKLLSRIEPEKKGHKPISSLLALAEIELINYYWDLKEAVRLYPNK